MDSPKLNVAVIGLGFMGATHLKAWRSVSPARLHTVVDADPRRLTGDLSAVGGNLGGAGERFDFSNVRACRSLDEALADPAIDAVDICLPTDQHAFTAMAAFRAGKHVLTEKPIALDAPTAEALCREAEAAKRILMAAHVLRFFPAYVKLAESVRGRAPVRSAFFRRRAAAPVWSPWLRNSARSGGAILDMLIHDADYCISLWGMPQSVRARGYCDPERGTDIIHADLIYPGLGAVVIDGGWYAPESYPFSMEFAVVTDEGTLEWSSGSNGLSEHNAAGESHSIELGDADPFAAELAYFTECALNGAQPERCPPAQSAMAVSLIARMLESRDKNGESISC